MREELILYAFGGPLALPGSFLNILTVLPLSLLGGIFLCIPKLLRVPCLQLLYCIALKSGLLFFLWGYPLGIYCELWVGSWVLWCLTIKIRGLWLGGYWMSVLNTTRIKYENNNFELRFGGFESNSSWLIWQKKTNTLFLC